MNLAPITTKVAQTEGQTRNFELEERVRNLESVLMDAQQKVEDTYAQLRQAKKETQTLRAERDSLLGQLSEHKEKGAAAEMSSIAEQDLQMQLKKLSDDHRQQEKMNKAMSKKIMDLEKTANDEKKRRVQLEDKINNMSGKGTGISQGTV